MPRFTDRHVVVTGAGKGIGRAIAMAFAREGAKLTLVSRSPENLAATSQAARAAGAAVVSAAADVSDRRQVSDTLAQGRAAHGAVDVLINNAGVFLWKAFLALSPEEWDRVLATNLTGAFLFSREVLPEMAERRSGRIINVSSIHGLHGDANLAAHCAAKFGLIGLTESLAREFRGHNVTVNALCPGTTDNREALDDVPARTQPLAEKLRPADVAAAALWLCSDQAAGITGAAIEVLGGTHLKIEP
jgi:NAD(P)-dependent dehydrogenase (short-subunit alcohol dehydrogenase family)